MISIEATLVFDGTGQYRMSAIRAVERDMRTGGVRLRLIAVVIEEKEIRKIHISFSPFRRRGSSNEIGLFWRDAMEWHPCLPWMAFHSMQTRREEGGFSGT